MPAPPTPAFSDLPKPTLPTIEKPKPVILPTGKPTKGTIDLGKKPSDSSKNTLVIVVKNSDVEDDDKDESAKNTTEDAKPKPNNNEFGSFSVGDWMANGAHSMSQNPNFLWAPLTLSILAIFTI